MASREFGCPGVADECPCLAEAGVGGLQILVCDGALLFQRVELLPGDAELTVAASCGTWCHIGGEPEFASCMDRVVRVSVVLALIAYSVFRLIRYFRYGMARRVTAVPPSTWGVLPATETPPARPATRSARLLAGGMSILVFATANAILWLTLFGLPALEHTPVMWRLFVGIFANFYVLPFARMVGEKKLKRMRASSMETGGNPFGS